jgi:hypothetical protein
MRILHVDTGREMRGGQWQVLHLVQMLHGEGFETLLLARENSPLFSAASDRKLPVRALSPRLLLSLSGGYDLIHAHDANAHTLAVLWGRSPCVVARRVAFPIKTGILSRWKYSLPLRFLAISNAVKTVLTSGGISPSRITVVPDGVEVPANPGFQPGGPMIAVESSDPLKGNQLARAAASLSGCSITFTSELVESLKSASGFLYISSQEGLGSAALLALAAGVPVIASDVGGLPEIVRHGETGLLTANNPEAVAASIRKLNCDPHWAERLGANGRAMVRENYTLGHLRNRTIAAYQQALS